MFQKVFWIVMIFFIIITILLDKLFTLIDHSKRWFYGVRNLLQIVMDTYRLTWLVMWQWKQWAWIIVIRREQILNFHSTVESVVLLFFSSHQLLPEM